MNIDDVREYIFWLKEFGKIYESNEELKEIFAGSL
jgi:hypothetical protein